MRRGAKLSDFVVPFPAQRRSSYTPLVELPAARDIKVLRSWALLENMGDPGGVADIIGTHLMAPLRERQELLATLDPVARLEKVDAMLAAGRT